MNKHPCRTHAWLPISWKLNLDYCFLCLALSGTSLKKDTDGDQKDHRRR